MNEMISPARLPLRVLITDPSERFQLEFAEQATALLAGISAIQPQPTARGLLIHALAERDLSAAVAMLQSVIPAVSIGAVEVIYLNQGSMEPYVRVRVTTTEEHCGEVIAQLIERRGAIECLDVTSGGAKIVLAIAPLAQMLGYDQIVGVTTGGHAVVDYALAGYRPI